MMSGIGMFKLLVAAAMAVFWMGTVAVTHEGVKPPTPVETSVAEREAWRKVIEWPSECEDAFLATTGHNKSGVVVYDLGGGYRLAQVACAQGAYQGSFIFAAIEASGGRYKSRLLILPQFESTDGKKFQQKEEYQVWGTVDFDATSRRLSVLNRFRGPGDCGTFLVYRFRKGNPLLEKALGKAQCDGMGAEHPERWPRIELK